VRSGSLAPIILENVPSCLVGSNEYFYDDVKSDVYCWVDVAENIVTGCPCPSKKSIMRSINYSSFLVFL